MKKVKIVLMVFMAFLIATCSISNIKAITDGETVSYKAKKGHHNDDGIYIAPKFTVGDYTGTCCQAGIELSTSGNARATKLSNASKTAKIAYYYGIVKGWQNNENKASAVIYSSTTQSYSNVLTALLQISHMGKSEWTQAQIDMGDNGAQESLREAIMDIYDGTDWDNINVPSNFEIFKATPTDNSQDFVIWKLAQYEGSKTYASDTPSGANASAVKAGNEIKYQIQWKNGSGTMTITDTISKGLSYVSKSSSMGEPTITNNSDGTTTLTWTTTQATSSLTYKVKVADDICSLGIYRVQNNANMTVDGTNHKLGELKNPVPSKCYATDTPSGMNGAKVKKGDTIKYSIKYGNISASTVTITDTISKGLKYVENSAQIGNEKIEPKVTNNSDGTTTLVWTKNIEEGAEEELTYSALVTGGVEKVNNNAKMKYDDEVEIFLNKLINPLEKEKTIIPIPDTGSVVAITGIIAGIALVGGGSYLIYRKYKKA